MRLGVRGREALVVSLLTLLVVATATAIHLSQVSRVVVQEGVKQAELIAKQIYAQSGRALQRAPNADPLEALRQDPELRSFLDSSVGYSPHLLYALISDSTGTVLLHTERQKEGQPEPARPNLDGLLKVDTLSRFSALYNAGRTYETVLTAHGWQDLTAKLHRKSVEGDWKGMADLITDEMLDTYAVTATYDSLHAKILERYEGLLDRTGLYQPYQPDLNDPRLPAMVRAFNG